MKAMILAAGLGTRLRPLTTKRAKALVPVANMAVIDRIIRYLKRYGISEIVVNAHHHHRQVVDHLDKGRQFGIRIEVRVEPEILGTGGGIKNTADFWGPEPFIVINGDIITDVDLEKAYKTHLKAKNLATLILHDYRPFNQIQIDRHLNIVDIAAKNHHGRLAFTGIHVIDPDILNYIPEEKFSSIIDCYKKLIKSGKPIKAYISNGSYWNDIGTIRNYILANKELIKGDSFLKASDCFIHETARLKDWAIIGPKVRLEEGVEIRRSILWEKALIKRGTRIIDSVVTDSREVKSDLINKIY